MKYTPRTTGCFKEDDKRLPRDANMLYYLLTIIPHFIFAIILTTDNGTGGCIPSNINVLIYSMPIFLISLAVNFIVAAGYSMPKDNSDKLRWFILLISGCLHLLLIFVNAYQ